MHSTDPLQQEDVMKGYEITEVLPMSNRDRQGWCGTVEVTEGRKTRTLFVSKWNGESEWIVDGMFVGNLPVYYNGQGSRCTTLRTFDNPQVGSDLDEQVRSRTGW